jgi:hypothetical protein
MLRRRAYLWAVSTLRSSSAASSVSGAQRTRIGSGGSAPPAGRSVRAAPRVTWVRTWVPLAIVAAALVPWTAYLAVGLPMDHVAMHWRLAWVGFDVALAVMFATAAIASRRRSRMLPDLLVAASVLLMCDAWFDVVTARSGSEFATAVAEALLAELPLALLCLVRASRLRGSAGSPRRSSSTR